MSVVEKMDRVLHETRTKLPKLKQSLDREADTFGENPGRVLEDLPYSSDGLFLEPKEYDEVKENHRRLAAANHFEYADPWTGNTRTYDPMGKYVCGYCNQVEGIKCALLKIFRINRKIGSCAKWEDQCKGDTETKLNQLTSEEAAYGEAANGVGFGCARCPYGKKARAPDSKGRAVWCGKIAARVLQTTCCRLNGAKTVKR